MDNPITRAEHEEFRRTVNAEFEQVTAENKRQNKRLDDVEDKMNELTAISKSVEKLAINIETMTKELNNQGKRLETIENRDGEKWRQVTGYIVTTIVGLIIGYLFTFFGM